MADASFGQGSDGQPRLSARVLFDAGRRAHPGLSLPFDAFADHLARHASASSPADDAHAADMFLACACAHGSPDAIAALDRALWDDVAPAVATVDRSQAFVADALQIVRERLLVRRDDRPPKIADYAGRASLKRWLCAVGVRAALSQRRRKSEQHHGPLGDVRFAGGGPELEYLRRRYKGAFEQAMRDGVAGLTPRQRLLMRLNVVDRLSIDDLAALYKVGRLTAARWLAAARAELLKKVRGHLREALSLTSTELESLARDVQSQLEVSVRKLLVGQDDGLRDR